MTEELELTMVLPERWDILALIELVGKQLKLNYVFDPQKIKGDVLLKVHDGRDSGQGYLRVAGDGPEVQGFCDDAAGNLVMIGALSRGDGAGSRC